MSQVQAKLLANLVVIKFGTSKDRMPKLEKKHSIAVDVGTESVTAQSLNCYILHT